MIDAGDTGIADIYIKHVSAWAPGINNSNEWDEWALGKRNISPEKKTPDLSFAEPMFKRRLSQISKMTIQVTHDLKLSPDTKIIFFSYRGELGRQFQINKMLIEENALSPASFSLSVFNAPAALATMALGLKGGYSCVYPGNNSFSSCLTMVKAALLGSSLEEIAFIYADEEPPVEYNCLFNEPFLAISFGFLLTKIKNNNAPVLPSANENETPITYLKKLLAGGIHVGS